MCYAGTESLSPTLILVYSLEIENGNLIWIINILNVHIRFTL